MKREVPDPGRRLGVHGRRKSRGLLILTALLAAAVGPLAAQQPTYVHGHVLASGGPPLQGAQLQVLPTGPNAETDSQGAFALGPLGAGTYHIRVRRIGFRPDTVTLKFPYAQEDVVIRLTAAPQTLDPVTSSALEQDLPRVMDRMREHLGATVFGPELMKQYPGIDIDGILATDSTVYPFLMGSGREFRGCLPRVYLNGKEIPVWTHGHRIIPDMDIRARVRMKDVAVIEVYRFAKRSIISEPWIPPDAGTSCGPVILVWTKDFKQRPYKGK